MPRTPRAPRTARASSSSRTCRFSYTPERPLITDLSFRVEPGQTVAIVGPTGAGKTTLVNLIMRFYELDGGRILLDGQDIAELTRDDVRSRTGMVLQDPWLFAGTIRDNIRYGRETATDEEIVEAADGHLRRPVRALPAGRATTPCSTRTRRTSPRARSSSSPSRARSSRSRRC